MLRIYVRDLRGVRYSGRRLTLDRLARAITSRLTLGALGTLKICLVSRARG